MTKNTLHKIVNKNIFNGSYLRKQILFVLIAFTYAVFFQIGVNSVSAQNQCQCQGCSRECSYTHMGDGCGGSTFGPDDCPAGGCVEHDCTDIENCSCDRDDGGGGSGGGTSTVWHNTNITCQQAVDRDMGGTNYDGAFFKAIFYDAATRPMLDGQPNYLRPETDFENDFIIIPPDPTWGQIRNFHPFDHNGIGISPKLFTFGRLTQIYERWNPNREEWVTVTQPPRWVFPRGKRTAGEEIRSFAHIAIPETGLYQIDVFANQSQGASCKYCRIVGGEHHQYCAWNNGIENSTRIQQTPFRIFHCTDECLTGNPYPGGFGSPDRCDPGCAWDCGGNVHIDLSVQGGGDSPDDPFVPYITAGTLEDTFEAYNNANSWFTVGAFDHLTINPSNPQDGTFDNYGVHLTAGVYPIQVIGRWVKNNPFRDPVIMWRRLVNGAETFRSEYDGLDNGEVLTSCIPSAAVTSCMSSFYNPNPLAIVQGESGIGFTMNINVNGLVNTATDYLTLTGTTGLTLHSGTSNGNSIQIPLTGNNMTNIPVTVDAGSTMAPGAASITPSLTIGGVSVPMGTCGALVVNVTAIPAWYQVNGGDIISALGNISTDISGTNLFLPSGRIGLPIYFGSLSLTPGTVSTNLSSTDWNARATYLGHKTASGSLYNVDYFKSKFYPLANNVPNPSIPSPSTSWSQYVQDNPGEDHDGYKVYRRDGQLTIVPELDLTGNGQQKVIIFVSGDLAIGGKVQLDDGIDFLMFVVEGNIKVRPLVGHGIPYATSGNPDRADIEGVYITNGQFITNDDQVDKTNQLYVRGIIASFYNGVETNGVKLTDQRDLGGYNATYPAEIFEFAPDQLMLFPPFFSEKNIIWKEVAP